MTKQPKPLTSQKIHAVLRKAGIARSTWERAGEHSRHGEWSEGYAVEPYRVRNSAARRSDDDIPHTFRVWVRARTGVGTEERVEACAKALADAGLTVERIPGLGPEEDLKVTGGRIA